MLDGNIHNFQGFCKMDRIYIFIYLFLLTIALNLSFQLVYTIAIIALLIDFYHFEHLLDFILIKLLNYFQHLV